MKKALAKALIAAGLVVGLMGCAGAVAPPAGSLYSDVKADGAVGAAAAAKTGEACYTAYLGMIATGDASIEAAKAAGGIDKVSHVDNKYSNILTTMQTYCTVVAGE